MFILTFLLGFFLLRDNLFASVSAPLAKVNDELIYQEELLSDVPANETQEQALDKEILFRLAVQEARVQQLDQTPSLQREISKLLYRSFIETSIRRAHIAEPTDKEIRALYNESPLIRLRHLVLLASTSEERKAAIKTMKEIEFKLAHQIDFRGLVLKYSQNTSLKSAGDLDFRARHEMPSVFYDACKTLEIGQISKLIELDGALHRFQLLDRKKFEQAPASYLQYLRSGLKLSREKALVSSLLSGLRNRAKIEFLKGTDK